MAVKQAGSNGTSGDAIDPLWAEATTAKDEAKKARAKAERSAAAVLVANEAHSAAITKAAEDRQAADDADKKALEAAQRARAALEDQLGIASSNGDKSQQPTTPANSSNKPSPQQAPEQQAPPEPTPQTPQLTPASEST